MEEEKRKPIRKKKELMPDRYKLSRTKEDDVKLKMRHKDFSRGH